MNQDTYKIRGTLKTAVGSYTYYSLPEFAKRQGLDLARLPFSIRILLENVLRKFDGINATDADVQALAHWQPQDARGGLGVALGGFVRAQNLCPLAAP